YGYFFPANIFSLRSLTLCDFRYRPCFGLSTVGCRIAATAVRVARCRYRYAAPTTCDRWKVTESLFLLLFSIPLCPDLRCVSSIPFRRRCRYVSSLQESRM
ncbi:unnamed protein product, partial [Ectocarpus sp. 4 AP-2014]